jgi:hypothetical protein
MTSRLEIAKAALGAYRAMSQLDRYVRNCRINHLSWIHEKNGRSQG